MQGDARTLWFLRISPETFLRVPVRRQWQNKSQVGWALYGKHVEGVLILHTHTHTFLLPHNTLSPYVSQNQSNRACFVAFGLVG